MFYSIKARKVILDEGGFSQVANILIFYAFPFILGLFSIIVAIIIAVKVKDEEWRRKNHELISSWDKILWMTYGWILFCFGIIKMMKNKAKDV